MLVVYNKKRCVFVVIAFLAFALSGCYFTDNYAGVASRGVDFSSASCKVSEGIAESSFNGVKQSYCRDKSVLLEAFCDGRSSSFKSVDCSLTKQVCSGGLCVNPSDTGAGPGGQVHEVIVATAHVYGLSGSHVGDVTDGDITYYHQDRIASTRLATDEAGAVVGTFKSLPFGEPVVTDDVRYAFATGKEFDESGLYYFGARYYDPNIGRFTSVDPVAENHPYSYVSNNPMNMIDPSGMDEEVPEKFNGNVLLIQAKGDHNDAFTFDNTVKGLQNAGYRVFRYRAGNELEFINVLEQASIDVGNEMFIRYLGEAHGNPGAIGLSKELTGPGDNDVITNSLTAYDLEGLNYNYMFEPGASGFQISCSSSVCTNDDRSMTDALADVFGIPVGGYPYIAQPIRDEWDYKSFTFPANKLIKVKPFLSNIRLGVSYIKVGLKSHPVTYNDFHPNTNNYIGDNPALSGKTVNDVNTYLSVGEGNIEYSYPLKH